MQGFNKYNPPDWVPEAGSLNKFNGKHALGDRARKIDKGILVVRFELPYNIWCDGCNNHIGMGVRYNAEKSKVGSYFSTPIFAFRCKCHLCQHWFEIRTDPQNTRYVVHEGARQKNEEWDPAENGGHVIEEKPLEPADAFASLERSQTQKTRALTAAAHLSALESLQGSRWSDPYAASSALRSSFRKEKKVRLESEGRAEGIRDKYGLGERVRKEDLRTPAREVRMVEDSEWAAARRERERREEVRLGKRKRDVEQVGWREDVPPAIGRRKPRSSTAGQPSASSHPASSSRPIKSLPLPSRRSSSSLAHPKPTSSIRPDTSAALQSLASQVLLNSALKADPFLSGPEASTRTRTSLDGVVKVVRRTRD